MSGASWPAAAWKPREAKEGAACRESVSWADGAKRVRRFCLTQKAGLPLPSDHSLPTASSHSAQGGPQELRARAFGRLRHCASACREVQRIMANDAAKKRLQENSALMSKYSLILLVVNVRAQQRALLCCSP